MIISGLLLALAVVALVVWILAIRDHAQRGVSGLVIQEIPWSPANPSADATISFTVVIKNQGQANAAASQVDYYIDCSYYESDSVGTIAAGGTSTQGFTWVAQPGTHTIQAIADSTQVVSETDETNNEKEVVVFVYS